MPDTDKRTLQKRAVGRAATEWLDDFVQRRSADQPLILGVGSGSTVNAFLQALAKRRKLVGAVVPASEASSDIAAANGLRIVNPDEVSTLELYLDGADQIDPLLRTIKGNGAALAREKVLATAAEFFLCLCDASKMTPMLQSDPLPVEVMFSALSSVKKMLTEMGGEVTLRSGTVTDNGNAILDVRNLAMSEPLEALEERLSCTPGVLDCGIFARRRADLLLLAQDSAGGGDSKVVQLKSKTVEYS